MRLALSSGNQLINTMPHRCIVSALFLAFAALPAQGQSGEELLDRLRARYEAAHAVQARFVQETTSSWSEGVDRVSGTLSLSGSRYRLESGGRTVATDGRTTWILDVAENQFIISDYVEDPSTFSINEFLYRFDERYRVAGNTVVDEGGTRMNRVRLEPLDAEDFFVTVTVWIRESDAFVSRVQVTDANDVTMLFRLEDIVERPDLPDAHFRMEVPAGVEVVDLRS